MPDLKPEGLLTFKHDVPPAGASTYRENILLVDYQCHDIQLDKRVTVGVLNFKNPDALVMRKLGSSFKPTLAWFVSWTTIPLRPLNTTQFAIPLLVLLPRNTDDPQLMTAVLTFPQSSVSNDHRGNPSPRGKPHIRWIHRM